jgi:dCTP deaminase
MILTGNAIVRARSAGELVIDPFKPSNVGPNSYDFRLGNRCKTYRPTVLDSLKPNRVEEFIIPSDGMVLCPSRLYLVNTVETMGSTKYVPIIKGRSSIGRLGLFINITADLIDIGSINQWTLQLHCVAPVRVYPGMAIGQVTFWKVHGAIDLYRGKYLHKRSPVESLAFLDANREGD